MADREPQHGIRSAYYEALSSPPLAARGESADSDAATDAANAHNDPHHVRHCFDYLRQALMVCSLLRYSHSDRARADCD